MGWASEADPRLEFDTMVGKRLKKEEGDEALVGHQLAADTTGKVYIYCDLMIL